MDQFDRIVLEMEFDWALLAFSASNRADCVRLLIQVDGVTTSRLYPAFARPQQKVHFSRFGASELEKHSGKTPIRR